MGSVAPSTPEKSRFLKLWILGMILVAMALLMPMGDVSAPAALPGLDKLVHLSLFFLLALCPAAWFEPLRRGILCALAMMLYGLLLEYLQRFLPYREFSYGDIIANNSGVILGLVTGLKIRGNRQRRREEKTNIKH